MNTNLSLSSSVTNFNYKAFFKTPYLVGAVMMIALFFGVVDMAHAADATAGGGAGLPWESPLDKIKKSISGPVAFVIALLGIIACGATLIWGGEVSEFMKRIIYVVLVICLIVFANTMLTGVLFSGAVLPGDAAIISQADIAAYAKAHAAQIAGISGK